mmetsp:Transcript_19348/g.48397  ORF Transcript_19348/g.48397 Transcript_19348/m.48397 type:complete len:547 (+) Transcript_19348:1560-3200(+)
MASSDGPDGGGEKLCGSASADDEDAGGNAAAAEVSASTEETEADEAPTSEAGGAERGVGAEAELRGGAAANMSEPTSDSESDGEPNAESDRGTKRDRDSDSTDTDGETSDRGPTWYNKHRARRRATTRPDSKDDRETQPDRAQPTTPQDPDTFHTPDPDEIPDQSMNSSDMHLSGPEPPRRRPGLRPREPTNYRDISGIRRKRPRRNPASKESGHDGERVLNITVRDAIARYGEKAMDGIQKEMKQMADGDGGFDVLHPVNFADLSDDDRKRVLPSHMFLKDKFDAVGNFEKLKARLVTGKDTTETVSYEQRSSPTVSSDSLKLMSAIAARDGMATGTVDFPGAFLNCVMPREGPQTYIRLNKFLTGVMVSIDARFARFVGTSGTMVARLNKALYGCVVAAKLWYELLRMNLESQGFQRSPVDMCVFARTKKSKTTMCSVHVDDVKIFAPDTYARDEMIDQLRQKFPDLKVHVGPSLSYLGLLRPRRSDNRHARLHRIAACRQRDVRPCRNTSLRGPVRRRRRIRTTRRRRLRALSLTRVQTSLSR